MTEGQNSFSAFKILKSSLILSALFACIIFCLSKEEFISLYGSALLTLWLQDENCHATSSLFHDSSVKMKHVMNEKNGESCLRDSYHRKDKQILIDSWHFGTMTVKLKRETDGTFLLYVVHTLRNLKLQKSLRNVIKDYIA